MSKLTHFDAAERRTCRRGAKAVTSRIAVATGRIRMLPGNISPCVRDAVQKKATCWRGPHRRNPGAKTHGH